MTGFATAPRGRWERAVVLAPVLLADPTGLFTAIELGVVQGLAVFHDDPGCRVVGTRRGVSGRGERHPWRCAPDRGCLGAPRHSVARSRTPSVVQVGRAPAEINRRHRADGPQTRAPVHAAPSSWWTASATSTAVEGPAVRGRPRTAGAADAGARGGHVRATAGVRRTAPWPLSRCGVASYARRSNGPLRVAPRGHIPCLRPRS